jgi:hypothetical protein
MRPSASTGKPGQQRLVEGKDGRSYWPIKRQAATADRIANHKGRNPQERASLKKRLLRKWMSK